MGLYYNGRKVRDLYYNGKCITQLALGKEMTRLVEGDDFVRAEWLVGDGTAYIDTLHNTNEDLDWETKVDNIRDNTFLFWFRTIRGMGDESMIVRTAPSRFRYANNSNEFEDNLTSQPINVETFGTTIFINGVGHSITKYYSRPSILFRLFYAEVDAESQTLVDTDYTTNRVKCAYFAFRNDNVYVMHLVPCRLLRPIPAILDANGIARNAGECGMFDSISGKFYGNVGSGTFTVSDN